MDDEMKGIPKDTKGITAAKFAIGTCIVIFIIMLFSPWYTLGGNMTYVGFVEIPERISTEAYRIYGGQTTDLDMDYAILSPIQLTGYTLRHLESYDKVLGTNGEYRYSILAIAHMVMIISIFLIILLGAIALIILTGMRRLKRISYVKLAAIISIFLMILNYTFLSITHINMFAIRAKTIIRETDPLSGVDMTFKGLEVNNTFYPYHFNTTRVYLFAWVALALWFLISAVLTEIKRRWDYEEEHPV